MVNTGRFDQRVEPFLKEEELRHKINKAVFGLELKISFDQLMRTQDAKLRDDQGNSYTVSGKTVQHHHDMNSLIDQYLSRYGKRPEFEAAKQKWRYFPD